MGPVRMADPGSLTLPALPGVALAAGVPIVVGPLTLAGWILDVAVLRSVVPGWPTMKANTAGSFVLAGSSVWLVASVHPIGVALGRALALVVGGFGLATLAEYI